LKKEAGIGYSSDVAFTPAVKEIQKRRGSRKGYASMEERGSWETRLRPDLIEFIQIQTSVFLGTASADGQPYIQHRGGPPGFLRVLDDKTIAFADFSGNRQYITTGNLSENPKAFIFLIDYRNRQRPLRDQHFRLKRPALSGWMDTDPIRGREHQMRRTHNGGRNGENDHFRRLAYHRATGLLC
jgi:predicted pyridoxine 5'-phosphate oxidase superfamily flavin-nucleotide-binding protein